MFKIINLFKTIWIKFDNYVWYDNHIFFEICSIYDYSEKIKYIEINSKKLLRIRFCFAIVMIIISFIIILVGD